MRPEQLSSDAGDSNRPVPASGGGRWPAARFDATRVVGAWPVAGYAAVLLAGAAAAWGLVYADARLSAWLRSVRLGGDLRRELELIQQYGAPASAAQPIRCRRARCS